jgi:hypothetical protein
MGAIIPMFQALRHWMHREGHGRLNGLLLEVNLILWKPYFAFSQALPTGLTACLSGGSGPSEAPGGAVRL